jgi:hypothetical protein
MIKDISSSNFKDIYNNDESYISKQILKQCKPYFNVLLPDACPKEKIQWFKNLFWLTSEVDLGLSHAIQHNQSARNYIHNCTNINLTEQVFNSSWEDSIGSDVEAKPSSDIDIKKTDDGYLINGTVNWLSNLEIADYATIPVFDNDTRVKIVVDLNAIKHDINANWNSSLHLV